MLPKYRHIMSGRVSCIYTITFKSFQIMLVQYVNNKTDRSDGRPGQPNGITLFQQYEVYDIQGDKFVLLNDENKLSRYSQNRFVVVDEKKVPELNHTRINELTHPLRMEIKRLREVIEKQAEF